MNFKKRIVATLCAAVLAAVCAAGVGAWDVYDTDYGDEYHEGSITYIDDDTEVLRENDDPSDDWALLYTVRPDGTAVIVSYAGKFMEGAKFEFNIPSEINGHTVVAIGDRRFATAMPTLSALRSRPPLRRSA